MLPSNIIQICLKIRIKQLIILGIAKEIDKEIIEKACCPWSKLSILRLILRANNRLRLRIDKSKSKQYSSEWIVHEINTRESS